MSASLPSNSTTTTTGPTFLSRVLHGTFWLALKTPVSVVIALWSLPLTQRYIGDDAYGDYSFAWSFGFLQFVLEFGMGSALQRQMVAAYARGDRDGVNRTIACGLIFYAVVGVIQILALLAIAHGGLLPEKFEGNRLVIGLLWIQILSTPFFGLSMVTGSVLQAASRYDFIPRLESFIIVGRFALLWLGYWTRADFLLVVIAQIGLQIGLSLGPALWVMIKELGYWPHFYGATRADFASMMHVSVYMALMQWSVVLADKVDATVLGYALTAENTKFLITAYQNISKPFLHIRQTSWTLAYLVMPAVVNLAVGGDQRSLDRIKYDGSRLLTAILTPITLLAGLYARTFLTLWVGEEFAPFAWMLQLFLVATLPLVLSVVVQMVIGMGDVKLVSISVFVGSLVNLPLSYYLTRKLGVSGVIWGTVLTTLVSNLLIPGVYVFKVLEINPRTFLIRTLSGPIVGAVALIVACAGCRLIVPPDPAASAHGLARVLPFLVNLSVGTGAYLLAYALTPSGRPDLAAIAGKLLRRSKS